MRTPQANSLATAVTDGILARYRALPADERRSIIRAASDDLRAQLATLEVEMAMDRSPAALAAVLTHGKEMQPRHSDITDRIYQRVAAGNRIRAMVTMPPRAGKSRRTSRWGPAWYLRRQRDHRY